MCLDYRHVNKHLATDIYPLPGLEAEPNTRLGSQPRGPGFDPRAEWKILGGFSDTLTPLFT